ncbi:hypothetical protein MABM_34700 [Mycobacteroides abscessus]|nr:hypothetical protein MABM_34700 [Mycobacteroides abscessus]
MRLVATHAIQTGVHDDAVEPAGYRGVIAEIGSTPVRRQHRLLKRVGGIFGGAAGGPGESVKTTMMTAKQLFES